jgi:hypothetical protein
VGGSDLWQTKDLQTAILEVWQVKDLRAGFVDLWQTRDLVAFLKKAEVCVRRMRKTTWRGDINEPGTKVSCQRIKKYYCIVPYLANNYFK